MRSSNVRRIEATCTEAEQSFPFMPKSVLLHLASYSRRPACPGKRRDINHGVTASSRGNASVTVVRNVPFVRSVSTVPSKRSATSRKIAKPQPCSSSPFARLACRSSRPARSGHPFSASITNNPLALPARIPTCRRSEPHKEQALIALSMTLANREHKSISGNGKSCGTSR